MVEVRPRFCHHGVSVIHRMVTMLSRALPTILILAVAALPQPTEAGQAKEQVTFTKDIAPILQRSCQQCHRPDSVAPMSLLTYEEARPYARAIRQRTGLRNKPGVMPPWYIEKNVGIQHYKDDI